TDVLFVDRPLSVGCLLTGRCNLRCAFCYGNDEGLPKTEMNPEEWSNVFMHMKSWGLMRVDLSGGEPTIREDIGRIARAAVDAGLSAVLSTNGLLLKNGPEGLAHQLRIHVSLDSGFEAVHEGSRLLRSLRPSYSSFERTKQFISKCLERWYRVRVLTCVG